MKYTIRLIETERDLLLSEAAESKLFSISRNVAEWQKDIHKKAAKRKLEEVDDLNEALKILKSNVAP